MTFGACILQKSYLLGFSLTPLLYMPMTTVCVLGIVWAQQLLDEMVAKMTLSFVNQTKLRTSLFFFTYAIHYHVYYHEEAIYALPHIVVYIGGVFNLVW